MGSPEETPVVLELRVHGVSNTSPADMLGLTGADIEQVDGDDLGSFWRPRDDTLMRATKGSGGWVPPSVQREAYSWGGLARTTASVGGGQIGMLVAALGRVGWTLLLPFGLTNVAYWTRALTDPPAASDQTAGGTPADGTRPDGTLPDGTRPDGTRPAVGTGDVGEAAAWESRRGQGAGTIRLFGLLLTLLLVVTACEVSIDLVAAQCYDGDRVRCTNLPSVLDVFASWGPGPRLALFSAVPVLVLVGLWQLTRISSERYEAAGIGHGRVGEERWVGSLPYSQRPPSWLVAESFWDGRGALRRLTSVHIAAGLLMVALVTAWPAVFAAAPAAGGAADACRRPGEVFSGDCWHQVRQVPTRQWFVLLLVVAAAVLFLVVAAVVVVRLSGDAPDLVTPFWRGARRLPTQMLIAASFVLGGDVVALVAFRPQVAHPPAYPDGPAAPSFLPGVVASPVLLTALLLGLATAGLALRSWPIVRCLVAGAALVVLLLLPVVVRGPAVVVAVGAAAVVFLVVLVQPGHSMPSAPTRATMWGGRAPGVLMLLALAVAATLSSIVVLTAGDWLNGGQGASDLLSAPGPSSDACARTATTCPGPHLSVATPYVWAGLVSMVFIVMFALGAFALWLGRGGPAPAAHVDLGAIREPRFAGVAVRRGGSVKDLRRLQTLAEQGVKWPSGGLTDPSKLERSLLEQAVGSRRTAAYAQRGERLAALFAGAATLAVAAALVLAVTVGPAPKLTGRWEWVSSLLDGGVAVITVLGAAVIAAVAGGATTRNRRPLGIVWDLICFLPRTGHPLGPPCYAERAVPEIVRRIEWWLDGEKPDGKPEPGSRRRHVILSAHSLGAVLAVSAICATTRRTRGADTIEHLTLLTYGSQLRPYFARLFPELLGPHVLGTAPVAAPTWWGTHPWIRPDPATSTPPDGARGNVRSVLRRRWTNLWRLTDPLGFPVDAAPNPPAHDRPHPLPDDLAQGGPVDRAAEEFDTSTYLVRVDGHSDYPCSLVYLSVLLHAIAESDADPESSAAQERPRPPGPGLVDTTSVDTRSVDIAGADTVAPDLTEP
jgi:hypothetical protein